MRTPGQYLAGHRAWKEYRAHLAVDDQRLAQMEVTTGQGTAEYFGTWCDRMSFAINCEPGASAPVPAAGAGEPEPEAGS
jgi:hypothetical protein